MVFIQEKKLTLVKKDTFRYRLYVMYIYNMGEEFDWLNVSFQNLKLGVRVPSLSKHKCLMFSGKYRNYTPFPNIESIHHIEYCVYVWV